MVLPLLVGKGLWYGRDGIRARGAQRSVRERGAAAGLRTGGGWRLGGGRLTAGYLLVTGLIAVTVYNRFSLDCCASCGSISA